MTWARLIGGPANGTELELPDFVVRVDAHGRTYQRTPTLDRFAPGAAYVTTLVKLRRTRRRVDDLELRQLADQGVRDAVQLEEWLRFQLTAAHRADLQNHAALSDPVVTIWRTDHPAPLIDAEAEWLVEVSA